MAVALNALGSGILSGVSAGTSIARNNRDAEKWDMYKSRQSEADATTAFATTLQDQFNGDMDSMLDNPTGQQIAFDYIQQNDSVKNALSSNRGWNPAGLVKGSDGNYFVMLRDEQGEHRPLTVDRASGTEPLRLSKQDLFTMMGASAAKLGVLNNPQMMKFLEETTSKDGFKMMSNYMGADTSVADNKIPSAPSIENVSKVARVNKSSESKAEKLYDPTEPTTEDGFEGKDPDVDTRYNKSLSGLVEGGISLGDLPSGVRSDIEEQTRNAEVNLDELSQEERQKMLGDEAPQALGEPVSRMTTDADTATPSRTDIAGRKEQYNARVAALQEERNRSGNDWTDEEILQAATADVTPDDLRLEARANAGTQPTFSAESVPQFLLPSGTPQNMAANIESSPNIIAPKGNTQFLDTAMNYLNTERERVAQQYGGSAGENIGTFGRNVASLGSNIYDTLVARPAQAVGDFVGDVQRGFSGEQSTQESAPQPAQPATEQPSAVVRSVDTKAVRSADAADPAKRDNIEAEIGNRIRSETPQQRISEDEWALKQVSRQTKQPTARQKYAAMRLYMSGAVPAAAYQNYLENGRWQGSDLEDAVKITNARSNQIKAQAAADKNKQTKDTEGRAVRTEKRTVYSDNLDSASSVLAADISSRAGELMKSINKDGSGLTAKEFSRAALDTAMSSPENVYLVSRGRTTTKEDLTDFEVQAMTRMVSERIGQWTQGKPTGWFSRGTPSQKAMFDEINLRNLSQQGQ